MGNFSSSGSAGGWVRRWRGVVASAAAFSLLLVGGAAAGAVPMSGGAGTPGSSGTEVVWEGPYASQEAPTDVQPLAPRKAVKQTLPVTEPTASVGGEPLLGNLGYYTLNSEQLTDRAQMHVNVASGNLMVQAVDVQVPGVADMGLSIGRWYNSRANTFIGARGGMLGSGWTMDTGSDIRFSVSAPGSPATSKAPRDTASPSPPALLHPVGSTSRSG